ncbi:hypothetical protein vBPaeTR_18 [Pseudomonas phage vB_Pae_TR]|nr:hypothetical protein vBPaeTR_18 [Pseudomonas phage vB_Pae_TR]
MPRMHAKPQIRHRQHATTLFAFEVEARLEQREVHVELTRVEDGATQRLIFNANDARALARQLNIACAGIEE